MPFIAEFSVCKQTLFTNKWPCYGKILVRSSAQYVRSSGYLHLMCGQVRNIYISVLFTFNVVFTLPARSFVDIAPHSYLFVCYVDYNNIRY